MRRGLLAVLAAGLLALPSTANAAEKSIWGPIELPQGSSAFPLYDRLGVDVFQTVLNWAEAAPVRPSRPTDPNDPAYRWPRKLDLAVAEARRHGISVAIMAAYTPRWANGGRARQWSPRDPGDYARFLTAASRRYRTVRRWMIWGEPTRSANFRPSAAPAGPRTYATLLDRAYGALKQRSRRNVVIGGMTVTAGEVSPSNFLRLMRLRSGRPPRLDWYGHNPFSRRFPNLRKGPLPDGMRDFSDLDTLIREIRRTYKSRGRKPRLWLSEFNVQSDRGSRHFNWYVSRPQQAKWLTAAYRIANRSTRIAGLGWYEFLDQPLGRLSANWGLMTYAGAKKPAYRAYWAAPSVRYRPRIAAPSSVRRRTLARGMSVRVRPKTTGRVRVGLWTRRGRHIRSWRRRCSSGRVSVFRVRIGRARPGRYTLVVDAPRAARLRKKLRIRK
jgi:hypothetical protein